MTTLPKAMGKDISPLRVLLVDDHVKVLESEMRLLSADYTIVAAVTDGLTALKAAKELNPDLIVLDIEMPELDGIQAAREMRRMGSKAIIVFLTVHTDEYYVTAARACGNGYVLKYRMYSDLRNAIQEALSGGFFVYRAMETDRNDPPHSLH
jgi:DNA-binding NarL/FixJ family response regulator